jgi:predicted nucleic acid-binding protein
MTRASIFVDTNVLVATSFSGAPFHDRAVRALDSLKAASVELWISRQVLRELLVTLSRPQAWGGDMNGQVLATHIQRLLAYYKVAEENSAATNLLLNFVRDGRARGKQVHDAAIAAVMLSHGIKRLLTLNTAHFERFAPELTLEAP